MKAPTAATTMTEHAATAATDDVDDDVDANPAGDDFFASLNGDESFLPLPLFGESLCV
jgi:hypothetical protein